MLQFFNHVKEILKTVLLFTVKFHTNFEKSSVKYRHFYKNACEFVQYLMKIRKRDCIFVFAKKIANNYCILLKFQQTLRVMHMDLGGNRAGCDQKCIM